MIGLPLALAAAATVHVPQLKRVDFGDNDYPREAIRLRQEGAVWIRVVVGPTGKPEFCRLVRSSGSPSLDRVSCVLVLTMATFTPARDADGEATYGISVVPIIWRLPNNPSPPPKADPLPVDRELTVNKLPEPLGSPTFVKLLLQVDAQGAIVQCTNNGTPETSGLGELACAAPSELLLAVERNTAGDPVAYVTTMTLRFTVG